MRRTPIVPGSTVGVLGSGQLGRMFAIAARQSGYRVHTYSPDDDTPTGQVSDLEVRGSYDDLDAVRAFARGVDVVTFEFENVSAECARAAAEFVPVRPDGAVLHTTQNRRREKSFLAAHGIPVAPFAIVETLEGLAAAVAAIGRPSILKTAGFGYDGKGQIRIDAETDLVEAWSAIGQQEAVLEGFIDFEQEVSVVAARGTGGAFAHYGVVANEHSSHILDVTSSPAAVSDATRREAIEIARCVLEQLDVTGVLCVEFFVDRGGKLMVNELAPRPHNSGHFTVDACVTSQFEQQLRAVCGLPLGDTGQLRPAAMANLLGDLWTAGRPRWESVYAMGDVKLHLYGKATARPGRKMGHLTVLAQTVESARDRVREARRRLSPLIME